MAHASVGGCGYRLDEGCGGHTMPCALLLSAASQIVALTTLSACGGLPIKPAPATPQRPTVSSSTATTAEHTFELEAGVVIDSGDTSAIATTLKYGTSDRTEIFASWSPWVFVEAPGADGSGPGDLFLGTRHRLVDEVGPLPSLGFQGQVKLPTADEGEGLGTGEVDFLLAAIATKQLGRASLNGFYELGVLGDPGESGDTDLMHTLTAGGGFDLDDRSSVFGELVAQVAPAQNLTSIFAIGGGAWKFGDTFVLDAAVAIGLSEDAPEFQILFGATRNFGALGPPFGRSR